MIENCSNLPACSQTDHFSCGNWADDRNQNDQLNGCLAKRDDHAGKNQRTGAGQKLPMIFDSI